MGYSQRVNKTVSSVYGTCPQFDYDGDGVYRFCQKSRANCAAGLVLVCRDVETILRPARRPLEARCSKPWIQRLQYANPRHDIRIGDNDGR